MSDHDKHGEAIESLRRQLANPELEPYHEVGLSIEQARALLSAPSTTVPAPDGHDDATARIEKLVREIEIICDHFGYDESQWLAEKFAVTEIAPTTEGLAGMVRNQHDITVCANSWDELDNALDAAPGEQEGK